MNKTTITLEEQLCPVCDGTKTIMGWKDYGSFRHYERCTCFRCGGRGYVKVHVVVCECGEELDDEEST